MESFFLAEDILCGYMIETQAAHPIEGALLIDTMHIECVHWTEYGIMYYGVEMLSGRRFFTLPVPARSLVKVWS